MKSHCRFALAIGCLAATAFGATRYVSPAGGDVSPYTNWASAAHAIQSAVDVCIDGDTVIVTDGVYTLTAPVAISNASIRVLSVNGPGSTIISGNGVTRGLYLRSDSVVAGFTITNCHASGLDPGAGVNLDAGLVSNCVITGCEADYGGAVLLGSRGCLAYSEVHGNAAARAGGGFIVSAGGTARWCRVFDNHVTDAGPESQLYLGGGGILTFNGGHVMDTLISNNSSAVDAGGVMVAGTGLFQRCIITMNQAGIDGGGALLNNGGELDSCLVYRNTAAGDGGGVYFVTNGVLQNCTVVSNNATSGGGVLCHLGGVLRNSVVYYNTASSGTNYSLAGGGTLRYTCTTPAASGTGNFTNQPMFVSLPLHNLRLQSASPCIDSGQTLSLLRQELDLDGYCRVSNIVDRGAYEFGMLPAPELAVTSVSDVVTHDTSHTIVAGTHNGQLAGAIWLRNELTGQSYTGTYAGSGWLSPAVALAVGANTIWAHGSNTEGYLVHDYVAIERLPVGTGPPFVAITSANAVVTYDTLLTRVAGTNNVNVVGRLWLTNDATGETFSYMESSNRWFAVDVVLAVGTNRISVHGTNAVGYVSSATTVVVRTVATGAPFIGITSTVAFVDFDQTWLSLSGTNNGQVVGFMWVTNALLSQPFFAQDAWLAPAMPLTVGSNYIWVLGSNAVGRVTNDVHMVVRGAPGTGAPLVDCTNVNMTVTHATTSFAPAGTNNLNVVGSMRVHNMVTGNQQTFPAVQAWTAPSVSLAEALNDIYIYGTNAYGDEVHDLVLVTRLGPATGPPFVDILTPVATGTYDFASVSLAGTNNANVTGAMWASNSANGIVLYFSALSNWVSPAVPLSVGPNAIYVTGVNAAGSQAVDMVTMVRGVPGTGLPVVTITNGNHFVTFDVATYALAGTNNPNIIDGGTMWVSNAANGAVATFAAAHAWQAPALALEVGANVLSAHATNMFGIATNASVLVIRSPAGSGLPFVNVLESGSNVDSTVSSLVLHGTNNLNVVGGMGISNSANTAVESFPATQTWTSAAIDIEMGYNSLVVWGTNAYGDTSSDTSLVTRGTPGHGPPVITLTTTNSTFSYDVAVISVVGEANFNVIGGMWVSNAANGSLQMFGVTQYWTSPSVALDVGANLITVYGTNVMDDVTNATVTITRGAKGTGQPLVAITTTPAAVSHLVTSYAVAGTNNDNVVGTMWVSNDTPATYHTFAAQPAWVAPSVPLDRHLNRISVGGTNLYGDLHVDTVLIDRAVPVGVTNYCALNGSHTWPFLTWATAATNLAEAIDEAPSANTVMTAPGTYIVRETLNIDRPIQVMSTGDTSNTIVLFNNVTGTCVRLSAGTLAGFTLSGVADDAPVTTNGGGIHMLGGTVVSCVIQDFSAVTYGGGVYHGGGILSNCIIRRCTAGWQGGGAYITDGGNAVGCTFEGNSARQGGGAYLYYNGHIHDCTFVGNSAALFGDVPVSAQTDATTEPRGGGVYLANGGLVEDCLLRGNRAVSGSGALIDSRGTVRRCTVTENVSVYYSAIYCRFGGTVNACRVFLNSALSAAGVMCDNGGVVRNTVITLNTARQNAGAQIVKPGRMENCTVASNVASVQVGGVYASGHAPIINSIVYANSAPSYDNVHGSADGLYCCTLPGLNGEGNITNDPLLAYPATGFCDLQPGSPCVDAGSNLPWSATTSDVTGRPRVLGGTVDIGAYEATNGPIIWADPILLGFGDVTPGEILSLQLSVGNVGDASLSGAVTGIDSPFGVSSGSPYVLVSGETSEVTIVFTAGPIGGYTNDIVLSGGDGAPVSLRGTVVPEPAAAVAAVFALLLAARRSHR